MRRSLFSRQRSRLILLLFAAAAVLLFPFVLHEARNVSVFPEKTRILLTGDAMFDRTVRTTAEKEGYEYLIEPVLSVFKDHDLVVMNIEGPITNFGSVSQWSKVGDPFNTRFTFSPDMAKLLRSHQVIAHLGNNHIWDFGPEGIAQTKSLLTDAEAAFFGDSNGSLPTTLVKEVGDIRIGFVSYNEFAGGSRARALESLKALEAESDFLILYTHWGTEYVNIPRPDQVLLAREFIDAGADIVVGSHPHVVQAHEEYKGAPIYYSLGNFVFDQYFEKGVRCGAMLSLELKDGKLVSHELIPVSLERTRQTTLEACE